jgi:hypothetical protein
MDKACQAANGSVDKHFVQYGALQRLARIVLTDSYAASLAFKQI